MFFKEIRHQQSEGIDGAGDKPCVCPQGKQSHRQQWCLALDVPHWGDFWGWRQPGGDGEGLRQGFGILILPWAQGCRKGSSGRWQSQGHIHVSPGWDGMLRGSVHPGAPCTQRDEPRCGSGLWESTGQSRPCQRLGSQSGPMASHHPATASATPASRALGVLALHRTQSREGPGAAEVGIRVGL